ncbi:MAG: hypothetical protein GY715_12995 [Planctomycetes bacterium]|nr:hypothetical protein [Planctomycetota bacterium]
MFRRAAKWAAERLGPIVIRRIAATVEAVEEISAETGIRGRQKFDAAVTALRVQARIAGEEFNEAAYNLAIEGTVIALTRAGAVLDDLGEDAEIEATIAEDIETA